MHFPKTVLQIIPTLEEGGAERTTVEIVRAIVEAGGRALVATGGGRFCGEIEAGGGRIVLMPVASKNPIVMAANARRLETLVRSEKVDLLHVRSRAPAWSALFAARRTKTPLVATYHGAYQANSALKRLYNSGMVRADLVIANSRYTGASIAAQYDLDPARLKIIPRGADLSAFSPEAVAVGRVEKLRAVWALDPDRFTLLLPARITAWKGHDVAIDAAALLVSRGQSTGTGIGRGLQLIFAGDAQGRADLLAQLQGRAAGSGVLGMVRFVGHCADMPAALLAADAVLVPSTRPEAFGRVAVEAGAMERVAIASDHGGARETIVDGSSGMLTPPGDVEALADAIEAAAAMGAIARAAMGAFARARIEKEFSVAAMQKATIVAYSELTG